MSDNKRYRFWQWAVVLLILCNLALIVDIWINNGTGPQHGPESPKDYVIRNVQLTPVQVARYDSLVNQHQKAMRQLRAQSADIRKALFDHLKKGDYAVGNANPVIDSLTALIGSKQREIESVTYDHFAEVRKLCTPDQQAKFDEIISEVTRMMGNGGGRRPPSPRDRRQDGPPPPHPGDDAGPPPPDERPAPPPPDGH